MPNTRCHHNKWAIDCDTCELESLRVKYAAVCDELESIHETFESVVCNVDDLGTIRPHFKKVTNTSSGYLKYFHNLIGKKVRISIEVLDD